LGHAVSNLNPLWQNEVKGASHLETSSDDDDETVYFSEALNASAFAKFMVACKSLLRAMTSKDHPIVDVRVFESYTL
jgi:hypothetical protein